MAWVKLNGSRRSSFRRVIRDSKGHVIDQLIFERNSPTEIKDEYLPFVASDIVAKILLPLVFDEGTKKFRVHELTAEDLETLANADPEELTTAADDFPPLEESEDPPAVTEAVTTGETGEGDGADTARRSPRRRR